MHFGEESESLESLLEDLEQRAEGLHLAERDSELADRARSEYASVTLASRVHASLGRAVVLRLAGGAVVAGRVVRAGTDWCLVTAQAPGRSAPVEWVVRLAAVETASGMSSRAVPEAARPVEARLGLGSVLRHLADEGRDVVVHAVSGHRCAGRILRVGEDFTELEDLAEVASPVRSPAEEPTVVVPHAGIAAVQRRPPG